MPALTPPRRNSPPTFNAQERFSFDASREQFRGPKRYRAAWISDAHLGTRGCNATALLDFLRETDFDTLYIVGDLIDIWSLRRAIYWPQQHNDVIQKTLRKARKGTRVVYVPGNHDEWLRDYAEHELGGIELALETEHRTAEGRRLRIVHGDAFDAAVTYARWLVRLGDRASEWMLTANHLLNRTRRGL